MAENDENTNFSKGLKQKIEFYFSKLNNKLDYEKIRTKD